MECRSDEKDITSDRIGAQFSVSVITIVYFIFILFIVGVILSIKGNTKSVSNTIDSTSISGKLADITKYLKNIGKGNIASQTNSSDLFIGRFTEWFTKVGNSINSGSILAILAAGVVIGFNSLIMTPIISTMFPTEITKSVEIPGKHVHIYPGQFFIALVGFIISLIIFFFVSELVHIIRHKYQLPLVISIVVILFIFLTFILAWNAMELDKLLKIDGNCVPLNAEIKAFQLRNKSLEKNDKINPPSFGVFG